MANKQAETKTNTRCVLIELKHAQQAKRCPINQQTHMQMLKEWLLSNQKRKNMHNQLKESQ